MKIKLLSFDKKGAVDYQEDLLRYKKMLSPWAALEFEYLKTIMSGNETSILEKEALLLKKRWPSGSLVISMAEEGKLMTSHELASWIQARESYQSLVINIGSAYGLAPSVKKESNLLLSLSPLTMPYKLCRLVLTEQLYRVFTIMKGHPYHK